MRPAPRPAAARQVFYYWYRKHRAESPGSDLGGFTRILHSQTHDVLSDEMHTVRVDPLEDDQGYVVLSRPFAFNNFIEGGHLDAIEEEYILMAEPDHILLRPMANFVEDGYNAIAFPFFYIATGDEQNAPLIAKVLGRELPRAELEAIDGTGNSPVVIAKRDFRRLSERWHDYTLRIFEDKELR